MSDEYVLLIMSLIVLWLLYVMGVIHRRKEKKYAIHRVKEYRFPDDHKIT